MFKPSLPITVGTFPGQTRLLLEVGFGGLLFLMLVLGSSAVFFLYLIEVHQEHIRQEYLGNDRTLEQLRGGIYVSGTYVRDFLLDRAEPPSEIHYTQFQAAIQQLTQKLKESGQHSGPDNTQFKNLNRASADYIHELSAVFQWSAGERADSYEFVRLKLIPKRMQLLGMVDELRQSSERQLESKSQAESSRISTFRSQLIALSLLALGLGTVLAGATLQRTLRLENEANARLKEATQAREELARLSADLVAAQENERRSISRELHDEVGQTLYATMLSLGNLRASLAANHPEEGLRDLQVVNDLTERTASVVRNIALLLRPAMLDDLGLVPALKWLARECTRTQNIPVEVAAQDVPEELPDDHVTCVYRIVQESIHNAQRHSRARTIRVDLKGDDKGLSVRVSDDGRGFDPKQEAGLGILGMRERASRLGGALTMESEPGRGATVVLYLPLSHVIMPLRTA